MNLLDQFIEKIAEEKFNTDMEMELIAKAQAGDVLAMKRLRKIFDGAIRKGISEAGISSHNVPSDILMNAALKEFRRSIESYDPTKGAKPSSWIIGNISKDLTKVDREYRNETRVSDANTIVMSNIDLAMKQLDVEDDIQNPTPEDIQRKIKENFEKDIPVDEISNILKRNRKEYSLNKTIGEDGVGENITFGDITNIDPISPQEHMDAANAGEKLNMALQKLEENDRKLYQQFRGIGDFKDAGTPNLMDFASQNNFGSEYYAKKKMSEIEKQLKSHLESDFNDNDDFGNK